MTRLLKTDVKQSQLDIALLALRIGIGSLMLVHGLPKVQMLFWGDVSQFPGVMGMSPGLSLTLAALAEVLCSVLILVGLGTRLASIPLLITMLVAVLVVHAADPFAAQELGLLYLLGYVVLLLLGGGRFSLDAMLAKNTSIS